MSGVPLPGIEHVVVVMFENRSFDNVLGGLYPERTAKGEYHGVKPDYFNPEDPARPNAEKVPVWQANDNVYAMVMPYPDPGESFDDMNEQIFGTKTQSSLEPGVHAPMNGFYINYSHQPKGRDGVKPVGRHIMQYYRRELLPVTFELAESYAVSDLWFASGPVQTLVNRTFVHCATPSTYSKQGKTCARINNGDFTSGDVSFDPFHFGFHPPVHDKSVFQLLDERYPDPPQDKPNWKVYYCLAPLSALVQYVYDHWHFVGGHVHEFHHFRRDVERGRLPRYSFIEPRYYAIHDEPFHGQPNSNHPGGSQLSLLDPNGPAYPPPQSICFGEQFLKEIFDTLAANEELFEKTLLIVTYDEHGGLFDHYPTPPAPSPFAPGEVSGFDYDRYGVRVPAIFVNPYIRPGTVHRPLIPPLPPGESAPPAGFDHTSIISTLRAQFDLGPALTRRDAAAPDLSGLLPDPGKRTKSPTPSLPEIECQVPSSVEIEAEPSETEAHPLAPWVLAAHAEHKRKQKESA